MRCSGKTLNDKRCKNKCIGKYCYLHGNKRFTGGSKDNSITDWLYKEIAHISKNSEKHGWISYQDASVYKKGNDIVIWSIEEDDPPSDYFITYGKYPNKLKTKKILTKGGIDNYIKKNYKNYKRDKSLDEIVTKAELSV